MAKASNQNKSDGQERKLGEQTGLDYAKNNCFATKNPSSPSHKRCEQDVAYSS